MDVDRDTIGQFKLTPIEIWSAGRSSSVMESHMEYLLPRGIAWGPWQQRRRKT
jgi:hypothetical protein